ncbi:MAG TPA: TA system VapC family ribonuclease toxin [Candidatus Acidoferrum sp.]|jgi:toxin-antitoxin system PIN domain toxin|nr:TA system VapC family ribonuclease toxin [Candidatus Acidoferrum sp.]
MPRFSRSFLFPDVNVWIALTYGGHVHHNPAKAWFEQLEMEARICFCRFTQLSLLRLLTTEAVMGADEVMTQSQAWQTYDRWLSDGRVVFLEESPNLDAAFRSLSDQCSPSPKTWSDSYLAAFAAVSDLRLVTFDRGFQGKTNHLLILRP